jgi:glycosyltransferase involved in cell wall biosynthesis
MTDLSIIIIARNEARNLEALVRSCRPSGAEIVIVDTGSDDGTAEMSKRLADRFEVFTACNDEELTLQLLRGTVSQAEALARKVGPARGPMWDFGLARQYAFSLATGRWKFWIDGDDELQHAERLPKILDEMERLRVEHGIGPVQVYFPYEYAHDEHGQCTCLHERERLSTGDVFEWILPVHEIHAVQAGVKPLQQRRDDLRIVHRSTVPGRTKSDRNLRILRRWFAERGDSDVRLMHYYANELFGAGETGHAIEISKRFIELSGFSEEQCLVCCQLADSYTVKGNFEQAVAWGLRAVGFQENWFESYYALARTYYAMAMQGMARRAPPDTVAAAWRKSAHFGRLALAQPPTSTILATNPIERRLGIHMVMNMALAAVGDMRGARDSALSLSTADPKNTNARYNYESYEKNVGRLEIRESLDRLRAADVIGPMLSERVLSLLDAENPHREERAMSQPATPTLTVVAPAAIGHPEVRPALSVVESGKPKIAFVCGPGIERWDPDSVAQAGIGGSETAVVEMAKRMLSRGFEVTVYGSPTKEAIFGGVKYRNADRAKSSKCDVSVAWRYCEHLEKGVAKTRVLWVHDVYAHSATWRRLIRADRVLALTQWHKKFLLDHHDLHPAHVQVTRNGIDLDRFDVDVPRNQYKVVCSSSPDRYLPSLLDMWPRIVEREPLAELHVFYGFDNWLKHPNPQQRQLCESLLARVQSLESRRVHYRGRVNQKDLAREFLSAGVWAYPTWFSETSCISAMEAQAAGLRMVTSPIAGLIETAGDRATMIEGDWLKRPYQDAFVEATIRAMQQPQKDDRRALQRHARDHFSWDGVADDWAKLFRQLLSDAAIGMMPPYKEAKAG